MRSELEIRAARKHLDEALSVPSRELVPEFYGVVMRIMLDILAWTLGEPSNFADKVVAACDQVDREHRRHQ